MNISIKYFIYIIKITILLGVIYFLFYSFNNVFANNATQGQTIDDGIYIIKTALNEKYVLDIFNNSKENGANLGLWTTNNNDNQKFNVKYLGNGCYSISPLHSDKRIDVEGNSKKSGANVLQWEYNNGDNQKWIIKDAGNGYYNVISKSNGLYLDIPYSDSKNGANVQVWVGNGGRNQIFKFEKQDDTVFEGSKTIEDGVYIIKTALNEKYVLDIFNNSKENGANLGLWTTNNNDNQKFNVKYLGNGCYSISPLHSDKRIDVEGNSKKSGANVLQWEYNNGDNQKWIIKDAGNGYYNVISKSNGLYLDIPYSDSKNGANVQVWVGNGGRNQIFKFEKQTSKPSASINIDTIKYPGYKESIEKLMKAHPNWKFELLYTGIKFSDAVSGEAKVHSRNLVETNYRGEWICSSCGTKLYDSGWYCASEKAIAYYLDPRNFLDEVNVFQFQDVNSYANGACTIDGIKNKVKGTFLEKYANDVNNACKNKNVNPYYIIARLIQEQGTKGTTIGTGMDGGDGKIYYNPFNIGASGNGYNEIYKNALAKAKQNGWDSMQKAIEGGIYFCKVNWLENYQNTLYQNKFDIDKRNGTNLYEHQYMQNLLGAYSEARTLHSMYKSTGKVDSEFTFIIPVYEKMDKQISQMPSNNSEMYPMNVKTTGNNVRLREGASTDSEIIKEMSKGTILLSIQRGINSNWQKVITNDGTIGYVSGTYLQQIDDIKTCNYTKQVKTNDGSGCNIRFGPGLSAPKMSALTDGTTVTVIDDSTYKNIDGYNWCRIVLSDGRQAFMPSNFLK